MTLITTETNGKKKDFFLSKNSANEKPWSHPPLFLTKSSWNSSPQHTHTHTHYSLHLLYPVNGFSFFHDFVNGFLCLEGNTSHYLQKTAPFLPDSPLQKGYLPTFLISLLPFFSSLPHPTLPFFPSSPSFLSSLLPPFLCFLVVLVPSIS